MIFSLGGDLESDWGERIDGTDVRREANPGDGTTLFPVLTSSADAFG